MVFAGLTGSIATGKSTVANMFRDLGCYVIDADKLAHKVYKKGETAYYKIIEEFGYDILDGSSEIDRKKLSKIVLNNKELLKKLESIVHPEIEKARNMELERIKKRDKNAIVIYDVPLLFEKQLQDMFDCTIVVYTDKKTEIERLMKRENLTKKEAQKMVELQMPIEKKIKIADFVIDNSKNTDNTKAQVKEILHKLKRLNG